MKHLKGEKVTEGGDGGDGLVLRSGDGLNTVSRGRVCSTGVARCLHVGHGSAPVQEIRLSALFLRFGSVMFRGPFSFSSTLLD